MDISPSCSVSLHSPDSTKSGSEREYGGFGNNICGTKGKRKQSRVKRRKLGSEQESPSLSERKDACCMFDITPSADDQGLFDFVLVDAECSHDGSIKHLEKFHKQWGIETMENRMPWLHDLPKLQDLQRRLLRNGYRNLKKGGVLVYSTCSFCKCQNQDIIEDLVAREGKKLPLQGNPPVTYLDAEKSMALFCPVVSNTSGLFVAQIQKT